MGILKKSHIFLLVRYQLVYVVDPYISEEARKEEEQEANHRQICMPCCIYKLKKKIIFTIEEESDIRDGKGRRCCLGSILECHLAARMI